MSSILKVNTIQNVSTGNTAMTINDSAGVTFANAICDMPKQANRYELIKAYNSTSNSSLGTVSGSSNSAHINFAGVFASHYISYKLIIGWMGSAHSGNHGINFRYLTGTNTEITNASYLYHITRERVNGTSANRANSTSSDRGQWWTNISGGTSETNVGIHGEVDFFNVGNVTVNGTSTSVRWPTTEDYAPICKAEFVGFEAGSHYALQQSITRYNTSNVDGYYTGFVVMGETGELAGTHMALYGLRVS